MGLFFFICVQHIMIAEKHYVTYINYLPMTTNSPRVLLNLQECYKITLNHITLCPHAIITLCPSLKLFHSALAMTYYTAPEHQPNYTTPYSHYYHTKPDHQTNYTTPYPLHFYTTVDP